MKKYGNSTFSRLLITFIKGLIVALIIYSFYYTHMHYYQGLPFNYSGFIVLSVLYAFMFLSFALTYGCFRIGIASVKEISFSYVLTIVITNIPAYLIISMLLLRLPSVFPMIYLTVIQIVGCILISYIATLLYSTLYTPYECIAVCANTSYDKSVIRKFKVQKKRFSIKEIIFDQEDFDEELLSHIEKYPAIIVGTLNSGLKSRLISYCFDKNKRLLLLPSSDDILLHHSHIIMIDDSMVFLNKNKPNTLWQNIIKRVFDIILSTLFIIISSPFMLIIAIAIKLYDGGPVIYKQTRYTLNNKEFEVYKFRSMIVDAEKDRYHISTVNDGRITPIGKIIRPFRMDELPQFFNILKGDMSIVGPRPERIELVDDHYSQTNPEFHYRHKVKTGLTGYAQLYGKYNTRPEDKLKMDLNYIAQSSFFYDLKLLFYTVKVLFMKESVSAFDNEDMLADDNSTVKK